METKTKASKETTTFKVLMFLAFAANALYFIPQAIRTLDPSWLRGFYLFLPFCIWKQRDGYVEWGKFLYLGARELGKILYLGIRELAKLLLHHPFHTAFVIVVTGVMLVIGITLLMGEEFQFLPLGFRITAICGIGLGSLVGSITWSTRIFQNKERVN